MQTSLANTKSQENKGIILPALRQDITVSPSAPGEDGSPCWLLYDPVKNQYYRIGFKGFTLISAWESGGISADSWLCQIQKKNPDISNDDLKELIHFLIAYGLTESYGREDVKRLEKQAEAGQQSWGNWLLHHYLYIRIPLFNPDRFLSYTFPYVQFLFTPFMRRLVLSAGLIGILLIIRQWETFLTGIQYFFSLQGLVFFGITLFFVKALHELGHAYTAKRYGCRVPVMGIAFLVLYPFLYTDTTDSWKLISRKQRMDIVTAGVKVELALALIATFVWSFLDEGVLRSVVFFLASTSWIASLTINLSPFMHFDGYYVLADLLGAENLQQRAFALAKWKLREILFGYGEIPPEALEKKRQNIFLIYAYAALIYRFVLFISIALLVYHMAFKILGIILFIVEISYFLILPISNEMRVWWMKRDKLTMNKNIILTVFGLICVLVLLFLPWQTHVIIPAVLEADKNTYIYPAKAAKIESINIKQGQEVEQGQVLFELSMPELENKRQMLKTRIIYLKTRIDRYIGSTLDLEEIDVLQTELAKAEENLSGVGRLMAQGNIKSPQNGRVAWIMKAHTGQWVSGENALAQIVSIKRTYITAYLSGNELHRIKKGANALFYGQGGEIGPLKAQVMMVSETSVAILPHMEMASLYGGLIAVIESEAGQLRPKSGIYKVILKTETSPQTQLTWRCKGKVRIEGIRSSPVSHFWRYALSVFIRESGM